MCESCSIEWHRAIRFPPVISSRGARISSGHSRQKHISRQPRKPFAERSNVRARGLSALVHRFRLTRFQTPTKRPQGRSSHQCFISQSLRVPNHFPIHAKELLNAPETRARRGFVVRQSRLTIGSRGGSDENKSGKLPRKACVIQALTGAAIKRSRKRLAMSNSLMARFACTFCPRCLATPPLHAARE